MIQAYAGSAVVLGVTRENINRLVDGRPIRVNLVRSVDAVFIVFGENKIDAIAKMEEKGGLKFEESHKAAARENPE